MFFEFTGLHEIRRTSPKAEEIVFLANAKGEIMLELIEFVGVEKVETKRMVISFLVDTEIGELRAKAVVWGYSSSEILIRGQKPKHFTVPDSDGIVVEFSV